MKKYRFEPRPEVPRHITHPDLQKGAIQVALIGCGGTGCQVLTGLGQIDATLRALPQGRELNVTVWDPDVVTPANIGRQLFCQGDLGLPKATVLVNRVNAFYGTRWQAVTAPFGPNSHNPRPDILISCVDTAKARRQIHEALFHRIHYGVAYWVDCGNLEKVGKVIVGQPPRSVDEYVFPMNNRDATGASWAGGNARVVKNGRWIKTKVLRLPCVTELYPELLDPNFVEDDTPSCSMVEAIGRQSLFVNRRVATDALDLIWQLLRDGGLNYQGTIFNLESGMTSPIPLRVWPIRPRSYIEPGYLRAVYPAGAID